MEKHTVCNYRQHIKLVGNEVEHCTGIRVVAAAQILSCAEIADEYHLFEACEAIIGSEYLFEGYSDPHTFIQQGPILGKGFPYPSIEAYIALYKFYGRDWLFSALRDYATHIGPHKYKKHGEEIARKWFLGAQAYFLEQEFRFDMYATS